MRLFSFGKLFCNSFQLLFFIEVLREERGRQGEDARSVGYETGNCVVHKEQISFQVKLPMRFRNPSKAS